MTTDADALVSPDVARDLYPHTLSQARRSAWLQSVVLAVLVVVAIVGAFVVPIWSFLLFIGIGAVATRREVAWYLRVRRADPISAYRAAQQRREHNYAWMAWPVYGPCVLFLILLVVQFAARVW